VAYSLKVYVGARKVGLSEVGWVLNNSIPRFNDATELYEKLSASIEGVSTCQRQLHWSMYPC